MRTASTNAGRTLIATLLALLASVAKADPYPVSAEHVGGPARSIASDDTSQAIVDNPANLSWLPGPELRWTFVHCPDDAVKVGCGQAWQVATPLPFALEPRCASTWCSRHGGGRPMWVSDTPIAGTTSTGSRSHFGTARRAGGAGLSLERAYSSNPAVDGLFGVSAASLGDPIPISPSPGGSRDFNRPSTTILRPPLEDNVPVLDARYDLGLAFRPTGRRDIDIGLELQVFAGMMNSRGTLGVDVPNVGRIFAGVDVARPFDGSNRAVVGSAGIELHYGGLSAGGGALFGSGLGFREHRRGVRLGRGRAYSEPGLPQPTHAVWIRLENVPSTRGMSPCFARFGGWPIAATLPPSRSSCVPNQRTRSHTPRSSRMRSGSFARQEEVLCSFEDAGATSLYVCANADRIVVAPAGGVRYAGLKSHYIHVKRLLDKVGVRAEFVRRSAQDGPRAVHQ